MRRVRAAVQCTWKNKSGTAGGIVSKFDGEGCDEDQHRIRTGRSPVWPATLA